VNRFRLAAALMLMAAVAACHEAVPEGQVVARVDGRDITDTELAAEARVSPAPRAALLDRLIDRALMAEVAHRRGADLSPIYLADLRRARDVLAVDALRRQIASHVPIPGESAARAFVAAHPWAYADRALVTLAAPDGVASSYDTATLDAATAAAIGGTAAGGTVVVGGRSYRVAARKPFPLSPAAALAQARAALIAQDADLRMRALLQQARTGVQIRYKQGFGPAQEP
jgi:hypothetical protein